MTSIPYSQLSSTHRNLEDMLPLPFPISIQIEPTNVCNFRCIGCPHTLQNYAQEVGYLQNMDMELYRKIITDINQMGGVKVIKLYNYGESLLHPDIIQMIELAKAVASRVEITTNASILTDKLAEGLVEVGLDYIRCSIYGVDQKSLESFSHTKLSPLKIRDNIYYLRAYRELTGRTLPFIYIKMFETTSLEDVERFKEIYEWVADEIAVDYVHNMSGINGIEDKLGIVIPKHTPKKICPVPFYQSVVGANGDVTVCCADWTFSSKVGNLREQSFKEIWDGDKLRKFQQTTLEYRGHEYASCKNCTWNWSHPDNIDNISDRVKEKFYK